MTSRSPAWGYVHGTSWGAEGEGPLSARVENTGQSAQDRGGTAHRSVRWGRPVARILDHGGGGPRHLHGHAWHGHVQDPPQSGTPRAPDQELQAGGSELTAPHCNGLEARDPSLAPPERDPSLATPEGGEGSEAREGLGSRVARRNRVRTSSATSSPDRPDLVSRGAAPASSPLGTASQLPMMQVPLEVQVLIRKGRQQHIVSVSRADWVGFDHFRHGASPDLVVALCLRQHLRCSNLVGIKLLSSEALVLPRGDWPASWEEFGSFVIGGGSFRAGASLRGGMDPARQRRLNAVQFGSDTDWLMLDRCLEALRTQAPLPGEAGPEQRSTAELMAEAMPLRQWQLMETVPGIAGRCNATPARMMALALLLARPRARDRSFPPCVEDGQAGQHVELRFNSIPPPPTPASGAHSADTVRDGVLGKLEELVPSMWADPAFSLRTVRKSMRVEGNLLALQTFSLTVLLPFGDWITEFLDGDLSLGPGSYATVAPFGTHVEVELTPLDHAVFRAIRLSLDLSHAKSLALLEDGLTRSLGGSIACRFTTSRRIVGGSGGGGAKGKSQFVHHSPDEERASTLFTMEAASLVVARRQGLYVNISLGDGDDQRPIALKLQLPGCPQAALYQMVKSRVAPPLQCRVEGTLFLHPNVLIGPLAAGWMTDKLAHSSSEEERLRNVMAQVWRGCVLAADIQFVGRRDKGDKNPLFIYAEFSSLEAARDFGTNLDRKTFRQEFITIWSTWIGDKPVGLWSCALLTEALEVVSSKDWKGLMELGSQFPCPPPGPPLGNANAA